MKTVIVVGAGSTLSDGSSKPLRTKPPLDKGFFSVCDRLNSSGYRKIERYLTENYEISPSDQFHDSLERVMAIIYADINNPHLKESALDAFRDLIRLFNARIAETTNTLKPTNQSNLYRILVKLLNDGCKPSDISIVTFNQDLQIEKILEKLSKTAKYSKLGPVFTFPGCYRIKDSYSKLSRPPKDVDMFDVSTNDDGIPILKLHGSLNWFSTHSSLKVPANSILSPKKKFKITPRKNITPNMTFKAKKRSVHTFPLIIPPVNHKAAIIHNDLHPIWKEAEQRLKDASQIVVFGYSCPTTDHESANLLRRASGSGTTPSKFDVIDPSPITFQRYIDVTSLNHLAFFRSADAYIKKS